MSSVKELIAEDELLGLSGPAIAKYVTDQQAFEREERERERQARKEEAERLEREAERLAKIQMAKIEADKAVE